MTGIFVRIERDGHVADLEIDELTDDELARFVATLSPERARSWVKSLAAWIRDQVRDPEAPPRSDDDHALQAWDDWNASQLEYDE